MANRLRNERLEIKLTEEEKALFEEKKRLAKCRNMSHFIRKCVLEKEIYQVDLEPFRDLQGLLSNATNNINQIAKRVNSTGVIYKEDVSDIKKEIEHFSKELWQIHSLLLIEFQPMGAIQGVWVQTPINSKNPQSYLSADSFLCFYYPSISIPFLNLNSSVPLFFTVILSITEIHSLLSNDVIGFSVSWSSNISAPIESAWSFLCLLCSCSFACMRLYFAYFIIS